MTDQTEFQSQDDDQETPLSPELSESPVSHNSVNTNSVEVEMQEVIGASFLGLMCLILLIVLLRTQRRNRQLTAELAKRVPRLALIDRPRKRGAAHG